jgi:hypothetical protein
MRNRGGKFALLLPAAMLALGLLALAWATGIGSSEADEGTMQNCPQAGKWAISVWSGDDGTDADDALATCDASGVAVAYSIDPDTQQWSRWFADRPEISTLATLDDMQGVMALGAAAAPASPTPTPTATPAVPDLAAGWTKIEPGGDTTCSQGTPYYYWVHPGTVNRLVVYFSGGGACWNDFTCSNPASYYNDTADDSGDPDQAAGIFDLDNPDNPFKDWFFVFIPYCTADIHWGDNTQTYTIGGEETTVYHKGFVNVSTVLDWIETNFEEPEKIFVSGCSAGSYGSAMGAPYIHELYPDAPLYQLGDAGAGVITDDFFASGFPNWGAVANIPDWIPALDIPWTEITMAKWYIALANYYSEDRWSQYNTAHDVDQVFFYGAMGGTAADWSDLMLASIQEIQTSASAFHAYTAPGEIHCITGDDIFYTREVEGVKFHEWVDDMVNDQPWDDVMCTDCETDPEAS